MVFSILRGREKKIMVDLGVDNAEISIPNIWSGYLFLPSI